MRRRLAFKAHVFVNHLAWKYAIGYNEHNGVYPKGRHILWRLNHVLARQWVPWFTSRERSSR